MTSHNHYDVIIIGTGAGGGTLAWRLAPTGKKILLLERGDYLRREKENWSSQAVVLEGRYDNSENWLDKKGHEFKPGQHYFVGGLTKFYGAALLRMREEDFGELAHAGGISPAWPVGYDEFEPYYSEAEHLYQVHGNRGEDPTEPWASRPYPHPAVSHEPRIQEISDALEKIGQRPFHLPVGIRLDESNPRRSQCIRCSTCDGFPCMVNAKADAQTICVDPALEYPNVTIVTNAYASRLLTDESGRRVTLIEVERGGEKMSYSADLVVVSAGAINSAALLLRSANERHPNGLANGSDQVGRNYMAHLNSVLVALSRCENPTVFQKTMGLNDFYFSSREWDFPMGHISFVGKFDANIFAAGAPPFAPGFTLEYVARHAVEFWLTSEDLPDPNNRITLGRNGQITVNYEANNLEGHERLTARLKDLLKHINCTDHLIPMNAYIGKRMPLAKVAHQNGTLRFGDDPRASVLDRNCKAHELDNLYVVDASFFPSSSAVNPALTIMANALRVGDHLIERMK
ncbi:MAG: GMC family oxidoreductase [Acidobacteriota bacterium]|nr:MAG: GMC family oxidoreductase [Acidobacteriota bacterium]